MKNDYSVKVWEVFSIFIIAFTVLISVYSVNTDAEEIINVKDYGAIGNGETDDTNAIQHAISIQSHAGGGIVKIPAGVYLINTNSSVVLKNNITLDFEKGAILKAIENDRTHYEVIRIYGVENVKILGYPEIQGDRYRHTGTTGEWGFGIGIRGAKNIFIENPHISDCWGDGIYIGSMNEILYSENVSIINPTLVNNRRQGISIISAKNLEIINANISKTNGTLPESGIDIEPNNSNEILQNIRIINLNTKDNAHYGLLIHLSSLRLSGNPVSIFVDSIENISDGIAVNRIEGVKGTISIGGFYYLSDKEIVAKPLVNIPTSTTTQITGTALSGSLINVKAGTSIIGSGKAANTGEFTIPITRQKVGTILSATATDQAGNISEETLVTVMAEKFSDVEYSNWYYNEIFFLSEQKIVQGFPNGSFQPNKFNTRAEAAKMLALAMDLPIEIVSSAYEDVSDKHWAKNYIAAASKAGLFNGNPDGTFAPDAVLKRAEMAKVISIAYGFKASDNNHFKDVKSGYWAKGYISGLYENGITTGYPDNTFRAEESTTRAEFSVFLARALNQDFR